MLGAFAGAIFGAILSWVSLALLGGYGFTLFLAIPFFMGYLGLGSIAIVRQEAWENVFPSRWRVCFWLARSL